MAKLRLGIIGTGNRGIHCFAGAFVKSHADTVDIVAFADPNTPRAAKGAALLGIRPDIHADAEELAARRDVDAVVIASIDCLHEEHALAALRHGKHVYIEKPLATTVEGCLKIIEAARRAGKTLSMGFNLRHNAVIQRLHELAAAGTFGRIFSVQAVEHYHGGRTYHSRWNRLRACTGGLFIHKGSHDFDVIHYILGPAVRPTQVACFANVFTFRPENLPFETTPGVEPGPRCGTCPYRTRCPDVAISRSPLFDEETAAVDGYWPDQCMYLSEKDTHDQGIAIVQYDNGATAAHAEYFATPLTNRRYLVEGTHGRADADLHQSSILCMPRWSNDRIEHRIGPVQGGHGGSDPDIIRQFLASIRGGEQPRATAVDGLWSVAVGVAAERARQENRVVALTELFDTGSELAR
ncbi:MAG: Gfo/Idh/MocA family oxidoreductase [Lentisphaeria bacterium]|nr:Gfo/Idh/MocA family oxidoreductase [Lentisphaeria bacterium]